jgi:hypothetical protein
MRTIEFRKEYFKNNYEWEYFLTQCDVPEEEWPYVQCVMIMTDTKKRIKVTK